MTRSPLFYPMHRGDADAGGAADLQTDVMRFMAILALCLMAIFALVQSIPLIPEAPAESTAAAAPPPLPEPIDEPVTETPPEPVQQPVPEPAVPIEPERNVVLTRPKWTSSFVPQHRALSREVIEAPQPQAESSSKEATQSPITTPPPPPKPTSKGFSLRFESDLALTRLVAAGQIGLYAIGGGRAQRMTVSESRISFWDASTPNAFHEMEVTTVPAAVIDALTRTGTDTGGVDWGVTLPGKLSAQLTNLMREHEGGALVIGMDGELRLEAT